MRNYRKPRFSLENLGFLFSEITGRENLGFLSENLGFLSRKPRFSLQANNREGKPRFSLRKPRFSLENQGFRENLGFLSENLGFQENLGFLNFC